MNFDKDDDIITVNCPHKIIELMRAAAKRKELNVTYSHYLSSTDHVMTVEWSGCTFKLTEELIHVYELYEYDDDDWLVVKIELMEWCV